MTISHLKRGRDETSTLFSLAWWKVLALHQSVRHPSIASVWWGLELITVGFELGCLRTVTLPPIFSSFPFSCKDCDRSCTSGIAIVGLFHRFGSVCQWQLLPAQSPYTTIIDKSSDNFDSHHNLHWTSCLNKSSDAKWQNQRNVWNVRENIEGMSTESSKVIAI